MSIRIHNLCQQKGVSLLRLAERSGIDPQAWSLASEVLGSERAHLDIMKEFLPHTEPVLNGDEIRSLAA